MFHRKLWNQLVLISFLISLNTYCYSSEYKGFSTNRLASEQTNVIELKCGSAKNYALIKMEMMVNFQNNEVGTTWFRNNAPRKFRDCEYIRTISHAGYIIAPLLWNKSIISVFREVDMTLLSISQGEIVKQKSKAWIDGQRLHKGWRSNRSSSKFNDDFLDKREEGWWYTNNYYAENNINNFDYQTTIDCTPCLTSYQYDQFALLKFGVYTKVYAMYGTWKSDKANEYGFKKGDQVFPSAQIEWKGVDLNLPSESPEQSGISYGAEVYTYEQIKNNTKKYFPLLAWKASPIWDEMPNKYDSKGELNKFYGEYPITSPDAENTTNNMNLLHCPDKDFYLKLYAKCAIDDLSEDEPELLAGGFLNFQDYVQTKLFEVYDPTPYNPDGSMEGKSISSGTPPQNPAIFNKDGQLISESGTTYSDPWDLRAEFKLEYRKCTWGCMFHEHRKRDVSSRIKPALRKCLNTFQKYQFRREGFSILFEEWTTQWDGKNILPKERESDGKIIIKFDELPPDNNWYLGNPLDNFEKYTEAHDFCTFDQHFLENGQPFKMVSVKQGSTTLENYDQGDRKDWYVKWKWPIIWENKFGNKFQYGTGEIYFKWWNNEIDDLMRAGSEYGTNINHRPIITGSSELAKQAEYDLNSKEYRTDQKDASLRNPNIEKQESGWTIARKIFVAEMFNFGIKALYDYGKSNTIAGVAYEGTKRYQNTKSVKKTKSIAKKSYKAYVLWAQTMDALAEVRDTYQKIGPAWDGLLSTIRNIASYYKNLDYSSIRLTNITKILPSYVVYELDYNLFNVKSAIGNFSLSVDALAFQSDRITEGHYGPFNPLILATYQALAQSSMVSGEASTTQTNTTLENLQRVKDQNKNSLSDVAYLSNITGASHNLLRNGANQIDTERIRNTSMTLMLVQSESRDWLAYRDIMKNTFVKSPTAAKDAMRDKSMLPIINQYDASGAGMFSDSRLYTLDRMTDE